MISNIAIHKYFRIILIEFPIFYHEEDLIQHTGKSHFECIGILGKIRYLEYSIQSKSNDM